MTAEKKERMVRKVVNLPRPLLARAEDYVTAQCALGHNLNLGELQRRALIEYLDNKEGEAAGA